MLERNNYIVEKFFSTVPDFIKSKYIPNKNINIAFICVMLFQNYVKKIYIYS